MKGKIGVVAAVGLVFASMAHADSFGGWYQDGISQRYVREHQVRYIAPVYGYAGTTDPLARAHQRNVNQTRRIADGIRSGELNAYEAAQLNEQYAQVQQMQNGAMADGVVTRAERVRIEQAQDALSYRIHSEKSDPERAWGYRWGHWRHW
ncbi:MAG: hypothetical protein RIR70_1567 [Pseudomonadota bacterium]|jgi:hypothetical protein